VTQADVVLHVRDVSHEDWEAQGRDVEKIIEELGLAGENRKPTIEVWNKIDALDPERLEGMRLSARREDDAERPLLVSALTGEGIEALLLRVETLLAAGRVTLALTLDRADGEGLAWAYSHAEVLEREPLPEGDVRLLLRVAPERFGELARRFPAAARVA